MPVSEVMNNATTQSQAHRGVGGVQVERAFTPRRFRRKTIFWIATTAVSYILLLSSMVIPKDWPNVPGFAFFVFLPAALIASLLSRKDKREYMKFKESRVHPLSPRRFRRKTIFWIATTAVSGMAWLSASVIPKDWPNVPGFAFFVFLPAAFITWQLSREDKSQYMKFKEAQGHPIDLDRLWISALLWITTAVLSGIVAFTGNLIPRDWSHDIPGIGFLIFMPSFFMAWHRKRVYELEARKVAGLQTAMNKLEVQSFQSDQPPVLYLRSFSEDETTAKLKGKWTGEEYLTQLLAHIGPVIAIGRPGERLPQVGARRLYVTGDKWQCTVEDLIKSSRLVALRTGRSSGLRWELRKCLELLRPEQLLIVVSGKAELSEMLKELGTPMATRFWLGRSIASVRAFVVFRENWNPTVLRVKSSRFWYVKPVYGNYTLPRLTFTLRPVFAQLGVSWPRPAVSVGNIFIALCSILIFVDFIGMWLFKW